MPTDTTPLIIGLIVFASALISLRLGISVAIIEIVLGAIAGNLGIAPQEWMLYLAGFGGIVLTYLAGSEIDTATLREHAASALAIGSASFLAPFLAGFAFAYLVAGWEIPAALLAGTAMSSTSIAVVYSALIEFGLAGTKIGRFLMASTFVTNMGTAAALSILFLRPTLYTVVFMAVAIVVILLATRYTTALFGHPRVANKVIEPEIKFIFALLLTLAYFASLGGGQAILPAFILGLVMARHLGTEGVGSTLRKRLRTVAYAIVTPIFFIVSGMNLSITLVIAGAALFGAFILIKIGAKFLAVYPLARRYAPETSTYTTLLMSTGLTFGAIAALFGLDAGFLSKGQYAVLMGAILVSAILPTLIAQRWFAPRHSEDLVDEPV